MTRAFTPFPNFDPLDGHDPRVTLSRDNPCRPQHRGKDLRHASSGEGEIGFTHGKADKS